MKKNKQSRRPPICHKLSVCNLFWEIRPLHSSHYISLALAGSIYHRFFPTFQFGLEVHTSRMQWESRDLKMKRGASQNYVFIMWCEVIKILKGGANFQPGDHLLLRFNSFLKKKYSVITCHTISACWYSLPFETLRLLCVWPQNSSWYRPVPEISETNCYRSMIYLPFHVDYYVSCSLNPCVNSLKRQVGSTRGHMR